MSELTSVDLAEFEVTSGRLQPDSSPHGLLADQPIFRADVKNRLDSLACLQFCYLAETPKQVPASSGTIFQQIGLYLLSVNPCNRLYLMWRILPKPELVVLSKVNPGKVKSPDCPNSPGYETLWRQPFPAFQPGELHELSAEIAIMDGKAKLQVCIDLQHTYEILFDATKLASQVGIPGIRSDNGIYTLRYSTSQ